MYFSLMNTLVKKLIGTFFVLTSLFSSLHAEVYVEEKVNSWTATGYLWVIGGLALVVIAILVATFIEKRNSKKND